MTNREKYITKRDEYDLMMMTMVKRGCPLTIVTGKFGDEIEQCKDCTEDCAECIQRWLNEEAD